MKIRISNVSEADFGLWRCLAKNSQGETSGEIKLYGMSMTDFKKLMWYLHPQPVNANLRFITDNSKFVSLARTAILNRIQCEIWISFCYGFFFIESKYRLVINTVFLGQNLKHNLSSSSHLIPSPPNTHLENPRPATTTIIPPVSHFDIPQHKFPKGLLSWLIDLLIVYH